jgi:hypothetical protein
MLKIQQQPGCLVDYGCDDALDHSTDRYPNNPIAPSIGVHGRIGAGGVAITGA